MKHALTYALLLALPLASIAAESPYAGQEHRAIKAMSDQEIDDYVNGRGMGSSKAAELNHYPGPRHVLDQAAQLGLSAQQAEKAQQIHEAMATEASRIGKQIVRKEGELEALFASGKASAESVQPVVRELGDLQAQFRLAHLNAHLSMKQILSPQQIAIYDRLRGYGVAGGGTEMHHGGHKHH